MSKTKGKLGPKSETGWIKVEWEDHFSNIYRQGWSESDLMPVVVTSVGVVLAENKKVLALAQNKSNGDHFGNVINILKRCIISRKKV